MPKSLLFAIDPKTEEIIVSDSPEGTNKFHFIERIGRRDNEVLYNAVVTLTSISKASDFDDKIFEAMDKVCRMIYQKNKEVN